MSENTKENATLLYCFELGSPSNYCKVQIVEIDAESFVKSRHSTNKKPKMLDSNFQKLYFRLGTNAINSSKEKTITDIVFARDKNVYIVP